MGGRWPRHSFPGLEGVLITRTQEPLLASLGLCHHLVDTSCRCLYCSGRSGRALGKHIPLEGTLVPLGSLLYQVRLRKGKMWSVFTPEKNHLKLLALSRSSPESMFLS